MNMSANEEKKILNRIAKEKRQRRANEAYQRAVTQYYTMPEILKANNVAYAKKKGLLNKYPVGRYPSLPLKQYKEFEEELKRLRAANKVAEAEERRREQEEFNVHTRRILEEEDPYFRKLTNASDPGSPGSPRTPGKGGKRKTHKRRRPTKKRKHTRKH